MNMSMTMTLPQLHLLLTFTIPLKIDVDVFGGIHRRLRGLGLLSVTCGYMVLTYYSMLISWVSHAFFDSFSNPIWVSDEVTGSDAKGYFFNSVIGMETLGEDLKPTRVVWTNVGCSFLTWTLIYLCVAFGVRWTGRIVSLLQSHKILHRYSLVAHKFTAS